MATEFNGWKKQMREWLKAIIEWQEANPDKDWLDELNKVQTESDDEGGDRPPTPPKNP